MIQLLAGLWLGGLIALDLIEAPTKFKIYSIERSAAVELGQAVFRKFGFLEMALSLALLAYISLHRTIAEIWLVGTLVGIALIISPWLRSRLATLIRQHSSKDILRPYHRGYVVVDILKMLLLMALALVAIAGK